MGRHDFILGRRAGVQNNWLNKLFVIIVTCWRNARVHGHRQWTWNGAGRQLLRLLGYRGVDATVQRTERVVHVVWKEKLLLLITYYLLSCHMLSTQLSYSFAALI